MPVDFFLTVFPRSLNVIDFPLSMSLVRITTGRALMSQGIDHIIDAKLVGYV